MNSLFVITAIYLIIPNLNVPKIYDPDVIRTRSLLIWSQTRYRCATESTLSGPTEI